MRFMTRSGCGLADVTGCYPRRGGSNQVSLGADRGSELGLTSDRTLYRVPRTPMPEETPTPHPTFPDKREARRSGTQGERTDRRKMLPLSRRLPLDPGPWVPRSEERRVGKECVSTCRYR